MFLAPYTGCLAACGNKVTGGTSGGSPGTLKAECKAKCVAKYRECKRGCVADFVKWRNIYAQAQPRRQNGLRLFCSEFRNLSNIHRNTPRLIESQHASDIELSRIGHGAHEKSHIIALAALAAIGFVGAAYAADAKPKVTASAAMGDSKMDNVTAAGNPFDVNRGRGLDAAGTVAGQRRDHASQAGLDHGDGAFGNPCSGPLC